MNVTLDNWKSLGWLHDLHDSISSSHSSLTRVCVNPKIFSGLWMGTSRMEDEYHILLEYLLLAGRAGGEELAALTTFPATHSIREDDLMHRKANTYLARDKHLLA